MEDFMEDEFASLLNIGRHERMGKKHEQDIMDLYENHDYTISELARETGYDRKTIRRILNKYA